MTADNGGVRRIAVLDAPSNLGLQPPTPGSVPGCAKAPGALRDHGLVARLGAADAGCVTAPRYDPGDWAPGDGVCQAGDIVAYSRTLADRLEGLLAADHFPVVLGGDCSVLLGSALALRRRGAATGHRYGLVFIDGHTDFRHPGNAEFVGAAAGEDLALVTGRGQPVLTDMDSLRPYFHASDVVVLGIRESDEYKMDITAAGIPSRTVPVLRAEGAPRTAAWAARMLSDTAGFWVHLDTDVLDPTVLPAVDAPSDGGIGYGELETLLADLVAAPNCLGVEVTVFDPDYDPTGRYARELADALVAGLRPLWTRWADARPRATPVSGAVAARPTVTLPVPDAPVPLRPLADAHRLLRPVADPYRHTDPAHSTVDPDAAVPVPASAVATSAADPDATAKPDATVGPDAPVEPDATVDADSDGAGSGAGGTDGAGPLASTVDAASDGPPADDAASPSVADESAADAASPSAAGESADDAGSFSAARESADEAGAADEADGAADSDGPGAAGGSTAADVRRGTPLGWPESESAARLDRGTATGLGWPS